MDFAKWTTSTFSILNDVEKYDKDIMTEAHTIGQRHCKRTGKKQNLQRGFVPNSAICPKASQQLT